MDRDDPTLRSALRADRHAPGGCGRPSWHAMSPPHTRADRRLGQRPARPLPHRAQRGVTMLFGLIALAVLMIGAAALVRSMNTSAFNAGNLGFKRELTNQAERAMDTVMALVDSSGALGNDAARQVNSPAGNYSAKILESNDQGIPKALIDPAVFTGVGSAANDIDVPAQMVTVRYVVDRLCADVGPADPDGCTMTDTGTPRGASATELITASESAGTMAGAVQRQVVFRLSIRVTGPRSTQAFFQTTFTL